MKKRLFAYLVLAGLIIPAFLGVTNCTPAVQSTSAGTGTPTGLGLVQLLGTRTALAREQTLTTAARPNPAGTIEALASQTAVAQAAQQEKATIIAVEATQTALTAQALLGGAILLQVSLPGNEVVPLTTNLYKSFPMNTITAEDTSITGPSLIDIVLHFIGKHSHFVTLYGKSSLTLYDKDINSDAILYLTKQGRVNFASTTLPSSQWPQDISLIIIR